MRDIQVDDEVFEALRRRAEPFVDRDPNDVLRRLLLSGQETSGEGRSSSEPSRLVEPEGPVPGSRRQREGEARLADHLRDVEPHVRELFRELNDRLLDRDSELQHHLTQTYIGYRRGSEFKASVTVRNSYFKILLPVDPREYVEYPQVRDITGKGRHGRTDHNLEFSIRSHQDIETFIELFGEFFGPAPDGRVEEKGA